MLLLHPRPVRPVPAALRAPLTSAHLVLSVGPCLTGHSAAGVIEASVDPAEWRLELERVAPQLAFSMQLDAKDWRSHLEQMQTNQTVGAMRK
jgi:hypothetical protein